jgi:rare lipoprotein A (peptidoglycan hydrolase)
MKFYLLVILICCSGIKSAAQTDTTRSSHTIDTFLVHIDTIYLGKSKGADSINIASKTHESSKNIKGIASFYSKNLDGTKTATGEIFKNSKFTGASNHVKLNTWVRVTNLSNGNTVIVRINDRMHPRMAKKGRVIDLSRAAAAELDFMKKGLTKVQLVIVPAKTVD